MKKIMSYQVLNIFAAVISRTYVAGIYVYKTFLFYQKVGVA